MNRLRNILIAVFVASALISAAQQDDNILNREAWGFNLGLPFVSELLSEDVYYHPILLMGYYNIPLMQTSNKHNFSVGLEPQINPVFIDDNLQELEFGCNVGVYYSHLLGKSSQIYAAIGTGPHFITVKTAMQHTGYIFSDNFFAGIKQNIGKNQQKATYLNLQVRFRHISNANIMLPNYGIDTFLAIVGFVKEI